MIVIGPSDLLLGLYYITRATRVTLASQLKFARRQRLPLLTATWAMAAFCYQMTFIEEVAEPVAEVRAKSCPPVLNLCFLK